MLKWIVVSFLVLANGCTGFSDNYGFVPALSAITIGDAKNQVKEKFGIPAYYSKADNKVWHYISTHVERSVIASSYSSEVVTIEFNESDEVDNFYETLQDTVKIPGLAKDQVERGGLAATKSLKEKLMTALKQLRPGL